MERFRSWGVRWDPSIQHTRDLCCPFCDWNPGFEMKTRGPYVVGFDTDVPRSPLSGVIGGFILECPKCFEKFWHHVFPVSVELLMLIRGALP